MCGYRTQQMCANLLERGVFDAPLKEGNAPRVGKTIASALKYCRELLSEGGICEQNLPSTYAVWKAGAERQCRAPSYEKYVYHHPSNGHSKSVLTVDYEATKTFKMASSSTLFFFYRGIIIVLFLLAMYAELRHIGKSILWVFMFPEAAHFQGQEVVEETEPGQQATTKIQSITDKHRNVIFGIAALRFIVVCVFIIVGVTFLMRDTDWVTLLLNCVALVFISEVASVLFKRVMDTQDQEDFLSTEPMYVQLMGWQWINHAPSLRDLGGFACLCLIVFLVTQVHLYEVGYPLSQAMECACLSSGSHCREARAFDHHFWDRYWTGDLPDALDTIEKLKGAAATGRPMRDIAAGASQMIPRRQETDQELQPPEKSPPPRALSERARERAARARQRGAQARERARARAEESKDKVKELAGRATAMGKGEWDDIRSKALAKKSRGREEESEEEELGESMKVDKEPREEEGDSDKPGAKHTRRRRDTQTPSGGPGGSIGDKSISWYLSEKRSFEAGGRVRRRRSKEVLLNKPAEKPEVNVNLLQRVSL